MLHWWDPDSNEHEHFIAFSLFCVLNCIYSATQTGFEVDLFGSEDKRRVCCITSKHYCF